MTLPCTPYRTPLHGRRFDHRSMAPGRVTGGRDGYITEERRCRRQTGEPLAVNTQLVAAGRWMTSPTVPARPPHRNRRRSQRSRRGYVSPMPWIDDDARALHRYVARISRTAGDGHHLCELLPWPSRSVVYLLLIEWLLHSSPAPSDSSGTSRCGTEVDLGTAVDHDDNVSDQRPIGVVGVVGGSRRPRQPRRACGSVWIRCSLTSPRRSRLLRRWPGISRPASGWRPRPVLQVGTGDPRTGCGD